MSHDSTTKGRHPVTSGSTKRLSGTKRKFSPQTIHDASTTKVTTAGRVDYVKNRVDRRGLNNQNVTTSAQLGDAIVISDNDIAVHVDEFAGMPTHLATEATRTADLETRKRAAEELAKQEAARKRARELAIAVDMAIVETDYLKGSQSKEEYMRFQDAVKDTVVVTGNGDAKKNMNNFFPKPSVGFARGDARTSWAKIQRELDEQIIPNELYDDGASEYELSTYMLTWIILPESAILGKRLNDVAGMINSVDAINDIGGVIVAATSGTDEFYIESLEFTSYLGADVVANSFDITIRSPFQADFVDHIFKAAQFLGIRNHMDIPMFLLINWNGRETKTSKPKKFDTSRCIPFRMMKASLAYDDAGGVYEVKAMRYQEHSLATGIATTDEDVQIQGELVVDMMEDFLSRAGVTFAKTIDNALMPDVYAVEMSAEYANLPLVTDKQKDYSNTSQNTNDGSNEEQTVLNKGKLREPIERAVMSANSSPQTRASSYLKLAKDEFLKTATFKTGTHITTIIRNILESTKDYQKMLTAHEVDPQQDDAQQFRSDKAIVKRYKLSIDVETEILGYDGNRRKYATRRIYICRKCLDPSLAKDDNVTQQTKGLSADRLHQILGAGLLKKAYPYYWSGLNTEIKSLDFKFDNHWIMANLLYSKMCGTAKRITGIKADKTIGAGPTGDLWNLVRDKFEQEIIHNKGAINKLEKEVDKIAADVRNNPYADSKALKEKYVEAQKQKKKLEAAIAELNQQKGISATQIQSILSGRFKTITASEVQIAMESYAQKYPDTVLMQTGHSYFVEPVEKFTGGVVYLGDMEKKDEEGAIFPIPMVASHLPKPSTGMREDYDRGYNILSEIVAKKEGGDMISIDLEIRGDPYWIPETFHKPNENSVSPSHQMPYLIVMASSTLDYNDSGIFQVNERSSINAIYFVMRVQNRFAGGEFTQTLEAKRDLTVELNAVLRNPDLYAFETRWGAKSDHIMGKGR